MSSIEVVQNLVLDTVAPFIERLRSLESTVESLLSEASEVTHAQEAAQETMGSKIPGDEEAQSRLDKIIEAHPLDAVPALWQFVGGKREQAPDGVWEVSCRVCKDHIIQWQKGDPEPTPCKTVRIAKGEL